MGEDTTVTLSTQLNDTIPPSKISTLSQGTFVGQFADNFGEETELKTFNALITVDQNGMKNIYKKPPVIKDIEKLVASYYPGADYSTMSKQDWKKKLLEDNYMNIKNEVRELVRIESMEFPKERAATPA